MLLFFNPCSDPVCLLWPGFFRWLYETFRLPIAPIYGGFPVKFRTFLGEPIPYDPNITALELAEKVCSRHFLFSTFGTAQSEIGTQMSRLPRANRKFSRCDFFFCQMTPIVNTCHGRWWVLLRRQSICFWVLFSAGKTSCPVPHRQTPADPRERSESPSGEIPLQIQKGIASASASYPFGKGNVHSTPGGWRGSGKRFGDASPGTFLTRRWRLETFVGRSFGAEHDWSLRALARFLRIPKTRLLEESWTSFFFFFFFGGGRRKQELNNLSRP